MAINDTQKTDFLWKRIIFGTTETDITGKGGPNETVPSPVPTYIQNICLARRGGCPCLDGKFTTYG